MKTNSNLKELTYKVLKSLAAIIFIAILGGSAYDLYKKEYYSFSNKDKKYISVVITNKSEATFTIPKEFRNGFADTPFIESSMGQIIKIEKEDDFLSEDQARIIAEKLVQDENCVLIIGNSTSSLSEVTLNTILKYDDDKPAYLLPIATADNIINKAKDQDYNPILRMMPNNDQQAEKIKEFIFKKFKHPKVVILSDEENTAYSHNLSQSIADKILLANGNIIMKKNYGNSNRFIDISNIMKSYDLTPDIIVFVGISNNGNLLKEELSNLNITTPIIFTDGCTVNDLMVSSENNPNRYFTSAVNIENEDTTIPTYRPVGEDAFEIAKKIITSIDGDVTRESVNACIKSIKNKREAVIEQGKAGGYIFNEQGDNTKLKWQIYSYKNGKLIINK